MSSKSLIKAYDKHYTNQTLALNIDNFRIMVIRRLTVAVCPA